MRRFYLEGIRETDRLCMLTGSEHTHLKDVLRLGPGEEVLIINGRGLELSAKIMESKKDKTMLQVLKAREGLGESDLNLSLALSVTKGLKAEWVIEKATELGANEILIFSSSRSVAKVNQVKEERYKKAGISALKQSGRSYLPKIEMLESFEEALTTANGVKLLMHPGGVRFKDELREIKEKEITIFIGPEGGFSEEETGLGEKHGAKLVTLGKRILRAETAALTALAIAQFELGDI
ncbi:MAG: 16S rRNA (uracil(1498)-N(3))-methyltransferase [Deltaproteobacteria bacterium]|nr:16S rRNA (uracil(1498)-N(3))-methyltransferase [Deltaproteobacteria bacterium]